MSMPRETADGAAFECEYCGARFDSTDERAMHWYRGHDDDLTDEERRARERRSAPVWTRAMWWVFGEP